jgi:hypothetical protein
MVGHPLSGKPSPASTFSTGVGGTPDPTLGVVPTPDPENGGDEN